MPNPQTQRARTLQWRRNSRHCAGFMSGIKTVSGTTRRKGVTAVSSNHRRFLLLSATFRNGIVCVMGGVYYLRTYSPKRHAERQR